MKIILLESAPLAIECLPLMQVLRPDLEKEDFKKMFTENPEYKIVGISDQNQMLSLAGFSVCYNFYYKKHLWIYDFVTDPHCRSKGYGLQLIKWLEKYSIENNCTCMALQSGLHRENAHLFYRNKAGFEDKSLVFVKPVI